MALLLLLINAEDLIMNALKAFTTVAILLSAPLSYASGDARLVASHKTAESSDIRIAATEEFRAQLKTGKDCVESAADAYQERNGADMPEDQYTDLIDACMSPGDGN